MKLSERIKERLLDHLDTYKSGVLVGSKITVEKILLIERTSELLIVTSDDMQFLIDNKSFEKAYKEIEVVK